MQDFDVIPERMVLALRFRLIESHHQRHDDDEASHHLLKRPPANARVALFRPSSVPERLGWFVVHVDLQIPGGVYVLSFAPVPPLAGFLAFS